MTAKERLDRYDREIAAIRKLLMMSARQIHALASAKVTEKRLQRLEKSVADLVGSLRRGGNGHSKHRLDLQ